MDTHRPRPAFLPDPDVARRQAARSLFHAAFACLSAAAGKPGNGGAEIVCRELYPRDETALAIVQRATAPVGTTGASGFASQLVQSSVAAFLGDLAPGSAIAAVMRRGIVLPLESAGSMTIPTRSGGPVAGAWVSEASPIPARSYTLTGPEMEPFKLGAIVGVSRELLRRAAGETVVRALLTEDAALSLDSAYLNANAESPGLSPQGLLFGLSSLSTTGDARSDLMQLAAAVGSGGSGQVAFIAGVDLAAAASIAVPELAALGMPVLPSLALPANRVVAIDPRALVHGVGSDPEIEASGEAVMHMSDTPAEIVSDAPVTADPVRSMWQTNSAALRMLLDVAFVQRRAGGVAFTDVGWF